MNFCCIIRENFLTVKNFFLLAIRAFKFNNRMNVLSDCDSETKVQRALRSEKTFLAVSLTSPT